MGEIDEYVLWLYRFICTELRNGTPRRNLSRCEAQLMAMLKMRDELNPIVKLIVYSDGRVERVRLDPTQVEASELFKGVMDTPV